MRRKLCILLGVTALLYAAPFFGQELPVETDPPAVGLDIGLGVRSFPEGRAGSGNFQFLSLVPDISIGNFGAGLDLTVHYRFTGGDGNDFEIRQEDWYLPDFKDTLALYFGKVRYVRYGQKGDPLYGKLGSIDDGRLGNGFIMSGYANTMYLPEKRVFGMSFDLDGALVGFPYVGFESFLSSLTEFDVFGARIYVRPLIQTSIPVIQNIQLGGTLAVDRNPYLYAPESAREDASVVIAGLDYQLPVLASPVFSLVQYGDIAFQKTSSGGMIGVGGKIISFFSYGAQIRILGENFIPGYFDSSYDLFRPQKYAVYSGRVSFPSYFGWLISSGFSLIQDRLGMIVSLDGPFSDPLEGKSSAEAGLEDPGVVSLPHLRGVLYLLDGIIPGVSMQAGYDKKGIRSFKDIFNPENAVIDARINYSTGPTTISFVYDLKYDPYAEGDAWQVTSGLESSITLY